MTCAKLLCRSYGAEPPVISNLYASESTFAPMRRKHRGRPLKLNDGAITQTQGRSWPGNPLESNPDARSCGAFALS